MISTIQSIITFDLETSGLKPDKNCILEIACSAMDQDLNDIGDFESGILKQYGDREITQGALQANGITMDQIESGIDGSKALHNLIVYFKSMQQGRNKPILAGHNIKKFDIPFLSDFFQFYRDDLAKYVNLDFEIDTMWWARLKYKESQNYKLGTCCEMEGIELVDAHRALNDTLSNKNLVREYLRSLKSGSKAAAEEEYKRPVFEF